MILLFLSQAGSNINSSLTLNNALTCTNITTNNRIKFPTGSLGTNYSGCKICLWPGGGLSTSMDWYGFGMNDNTLVYNVPSGMKHSFQINGTENTYIDSTGITSTNITCNSIQANPTQQPPNANIISDTYYIAGTEYVAINSTGLSCTNITCNSIQANPTQQPPNANYIGYLL